MAERIVNDDEQMQEEARRRNSIEPIPHRGESEDIEDVDPQYRNKVADALHKSVGESQDNNDDSRVDSDQGSHHGMGNK